MKEIVNDGFAKVVKPYMDAQDKKSREIIAPVEVSPAEAPHSVGDQIIYNGLLYNVTAPIEVEDSLETSGAGANISAADNIEAQIKATKSQIQAAAAQAAAQNKNTQEMIAPVEEDETDASRDYAIGDQLILDGVLYNVIDAIAQHGIITSEGAGANIEEADNVTDQLSSLNGDLTNLDSKAYKTDDAAITEVASDDLLPIYDTSAAAKKKITVNNFVGGLVSNRNLLDNPWFTVNQRGASSYTSSSSVIYCVDRWDINQDASVTINTDKSITLTNASSSRRAIEQRIEKGILKPNTKYTVSILLADGKVYSGSITMPSAIPTSGSDDLGSWGTGGNTIRIQYSTNYDSVLFLVASNASETIKAVKLELGSVSTFAQDIEPNYGEELLKCQRYFQIVRANTRLRICGYNATTFRATLSIPTDMRVTPTLSNAILELKSLDENTTLAANTQGADGSKGNILLWASGQSHSLTDGQIHIPSTSDLWLSADL